MRMKSCDHAKCSDQSCWRGWKSGAGRPVSGSTASVDTYLPLLHRWHDSARFEWLSEPPRELGMICSTENESAENLSGVWQYSQRYRARLATALRSSAEMAMSNHRWRRDAQLVEQSGQRCTAQTGQFRQMLHPTGVQVLD